MRNKAEYITCAAIWFKDQYHREHQPTNVTLGFVVAGLRHCNCFATCKILSAGVQLMEQEQGFLTSHNRFVGRVEAMKIARKRRQVKPSVRQNWLDSSDLY